MGIEITPLGYQKPDGNELFRNGDNVISHNAQKSQELLSEARARIANLQAIGFSTGFDGGDPFSNFSRSFDGGTPETVFTPEDAVIDPLGLNDSAVAQALLGGPESSVALNTAVAESDAVSGKLDKSSAPISVRDTGAIGNNAADDTYAFQAAVDAAPVGGVVWIPASAAAYKITGSLSINKALTILNMGGKINFTGTGVSLFRITSSDVSIFDVVASGTGITGTRVERSNAVWATGTLASPLTDLRIEGCKFTGFADSGIWLEYVTRATVCNNTIVDVLYAGIMGLTAVDSRFDGNKVSNVVQKAPIVNTYGIALSDLDNTIAARSRNCTVNDNIIRDVPDWEGIDTHGGENITVTGNTVRRCARGIAMVSGNPERVAAPTSVTVVGNTVDCGTIPNPVYGIMIAGVDGTTLATGTIDGNTIVGYGAVSPISRTNIDSTKTVIGFNAGAFQRPPISTAYGTLDIGVVAGSGGSFSLAVTFPEGRFTSAPVVMVSSGSTRLNVAWASVTSSGFTFQATNWTPADSATDTVGHWVAVQV